MVYLDIDCLNIILANRIWPLNCFENFFENPNNKLSAIGDVKSKLRYLFLSFDFLGPLLAGKWAWPPRAPLMVWGLQTRKKLPHWENLLANHDLEIMFSKFSRVNPPPLKIG